ncbi:alpha-L-arabinofuranosidase C-terminal domain-containing protein [bacterium]
MRNIFSIFIFLLLTIQAFPQSRLDTLIIDFAQQEPEIPKTLYGIFFEEINHAGDGGLYAEMIRNRGFEAKAVPPSCQVQDGLLHAPKGQQNYLHGMITNFTIPWDTTDQWPGWSLVFHEPSHAVMKLATEYPLHEATPHAMQIDITNASKRTPVQLINDGFWGIATKRGESYQIKFHLKIPPGKINKVTVLLLGYGDMLVGGKQFSIQDDDQWHVYKDIIRATASYSEVKLALVFDSPGTIWADYVSLFPVETFNNRENGLRKDVAKMLNDLKPAFMRWPGGCIVEGLTLENRVKWKETIGDPVTRPGMFDLWGYHSTYGFGYHEFLQFCEDIGADAMFVCNAGLSCGYRNGDYCPEEEIEFFIDDALDAIEYALGVPYSEWGRKRVHSGHPGPFPLKYIEVGNENYGPLYAKRFNRFFQAIKEKYPQLTVITSIQNPNDLQYIETADMIDSHYYHSPDWFYRNTTLYDKLQPRQNYKLYIGEYACNRGVGSGNLNGALSEAAFMTGMERNSDLVTMSSYAPLIENSNARNWPVNLIWVKSDRVIGRSSYYVQKLFAENRPDVNLKSNFKVKSIFLDSTFFAGKVGLATWQTHASYKDLKITRNGKVLYQSKFNNQPKNWVCESGEWQAQNGAFSQIDFGDRRLSYLNLDGLDQYTVEVKAKKHGGADGFNLIFGLKATNDYFIYNVGGWGNAQIAIEQIGPDISEMLSEPTPFTVKTDQWYSLKLVVGSNRIQGYVDDSLMVDYTMNTIEKRFVATGYDRESNEIIIKVVNAESAPYETEIKILNGGSIYPTGLIITLSSDSLEHENSFDNPRKIYPIWKSDYKFSEQFSMTFKPYSLTILRIRRQ